MTENAVKRLYYDKFSTIKNNKFKLVKTVSFKMQKLAISKNIDMKIAQEQKT